ncbi:MAG: tetratricopeptide repeat protein [Vulcanimicrobiaceae bacterium]
MVNHSGLPRRIVIPLFGLFAIAFIGIMGYLLWIGYGQSGSVFGSAVGANPGATAPQTGANAVQGGGPPPQVAAALATLRARIAAHPNDDVALTQLGDMFLSVGKFTEAIPYYKRALIANPKNFAAQTGLSEAKESLRESNSQ